ncbi:unnamed protein product [Oreochromis niloticus]|nr:unnamed protein product [Mustela putorius furo]
MLDLLSRADNRYQPGANRFQEETGDKTPVQREKMICRILLLIILTSCVSGSFVVNVTQTSYQAEENHNITLEWTFTTEPDRSSKTLNILCELFISDKSSVLYHVHEGVEVSESQDEKFSGRVQSDKDALREGRIRLQLSRLRTDDSGESVKPMQTNHGSSFKDCKLSVTGHPRTELALLISLFSLFLSPAEMLPPQQTTP